MCRKVCRKLFRSAFTYVYLLKRNKTKTIETKQNKNKQTITTKWRTGARRDVEGEGRLAVGEGEEGVTETMMDEVMLICVRHNTLPWDKKVDIGHNHANVSWCNSTIIEPIRQKGTQNNV